tara:strand:+ start:637 stop:846 length:210 start_codon:yes stop_codon:yes gene_type:complete
MEKLYRIEELTTEGWTLMSNRDCKLTRALCDTRLSEYVEGGSNPNRMRAVVDNPETFHIETGTTEHPSK